MERKLLLPMAIASVVVSLLSAGQAEAILLDTFDPQLAPVTATQSGSAPGPIVTGGGPTGNFLRLVNDGVNSQVNHWSYHLTDPGAHNTIIAGFDIRATSVGDAADGLAMIFVPTSTFGPTGAGPAGGFNAEEPNIPNAFALGIDLYPPGSQNDVSVHFNGTEFRNITMPNGDIDLDNGVFHRATVILQHVDGGAYALVAMTNDVNGPATTTAPIAQFIPGLMPYESRVQFSGRTGGADFNGDIDNVFVSYGDAVLPEGTMQGFEGVVAIGTPFHFGQFNAGPGPIVRSGGPTGNFLRLMNDGVNDQANSVTFAATADGLSAAGMTEGGRISGSFDFRAFSPNDAAADGFGFILARTDTVGLNGPGHYAGGGIEEPNIANVFAIGFDLHPAGSVNDVSAHWNGAEILNVTLDPSDIDLDGNQFHHVRFDLVKVAGGAQFSLYLTPDAFGTPGPEITAIEDLFIAGLDFYDYRVEIAGRTGGLNVGVDIDNVNVRTVPTPEPATAALGVMTLGLLSLRRRGRAA